MTKKHMKLTSVVGKFGKLDQLRNLVANCTKMGPKCEKCPPLKMLVCSLCWVAGDSPQDQYFAGASLWICEQKSESLIMMMMMLPRMAPSIFLFAEVFIGK